MFNNIYTGRRVLITGHAGFKGSWLAFWLKQMGAHVYGYSLLPDTNPRMYDVLKLGDLIDGEMIADIRDTEKLNAFFASVPYA